MKNISRVGVRNKINTATRRHTLAEVISESYNLLYDCKKDSKAYRLVESHIQNIRQNPENLDELSRDLCTLKGVVALGDAAKIHESDIPSDTQNFTNGMKLSQKSLDKDRDVEEKGDRDVINEEEEIPVEEEDPAEENLSEEDEIPVEEEEPVIEEEEEISPEEEEPVIEEEEEITPEELQELKKHLKEMRQARKIKESKRKTMKESRTWVSERSSMSDALKHFRESSTNKAFYNTFTKMNSRLKESKPLTLQESLLLYKASNSAMTQLAIELERNPEFIYTFRECTDILSKDTGALLECIRKHKAPSKSLLESLHAFSCILLESEDIVDEYEEEEEVVENEENTEVISPETEEPVIEEEEEISSEEEEPVIEEEEEIDATQEEVPEEDIVEEDENPDDLVLEEEDEENPEITDEEAEALRKKLQELRQGKKLSK